MNATQLSMEKLTAIFKEAGGAPLWKFRGSFGEVQAWLINGEFRLIHRLQGDNGVEVYEPIYAETFEELVTLVVPESVEPSAEGLNGRLGDN